MAAQFSPTVMTRWPRPHALVFQPSGRLLHALPELRIAHDAAAFLVQKTASGWLAWQAST